MTTLPLPEITRADATASAFVVLCQRWDGSLREWKRYSTQVEAERVALKLTAIGCPSIVQTWDASASQWRSNT